MCDSTVSVTCLSYNSMSLKTVSFNCHGLKTSLEDVHELCKSYDIVFLQELWLCKDELHILHNIHADYDAVGVSAVDESTNIRKGRPHGGVAILIHKRHRSLTQFHTIMNEFISVHIDYGSESLSFINVYMPYLCDANIDIFMECIWKIEAIIEAVPSTKVIVVDDFNANIDTTFEREFLELCKRTKFIISDNEWLGKNSKCYTYVSDAHLTTS